MSCLRVQSVLIAATLAAGPALAAPIATAQPADTQPAASSAPVITLLKAGQSPRQTLRVRPRVGSSRVFEIIMKFTLQQVPEGGVPVEQKTTTRFVVSTTVSEITDEGDIAYELDLTDVDLVPEEDAPPMAFEASRAMLRTMIGLRATGVISDRGVAGKASVRPPRGMDRRLQPAAQNFRQLVELWVAPLPAQPVGLGAAWQVARPIDQEGITIDQTAVYTLTATDGTTFELTMDLKQHADPQPINSPRLRPGTTWNLKSLTAAGRGRAVVSLDEVFPTERVLEVTNDSEFDIRVGTVLQKIRQHTEQSTTMKVVGSERD